MTKTELIRAATLGAVSGLITVLLLSCAPDLVRLGPGECVVIPEKGSIITVGNDCRAQRLYR